MSNSGDYKPDETALKEKLWKLLRKNRTLAYTTDEESGTVAGPTDRNGMKNQAKEDDEQYKK